jgi:hypothetical protein
MIRDEITKRSEFHYPLQKLLIDDYNKNNDDDYADEEEDNDEEEEEDNDEVTDMKNQSDYLETFFKDWLKKFY